VVVEARGNHTAVEGKPYSNTCCFVFRLEGGKLKEATGYADAGLVTKVLGES